jgi:hypothetical protein
LDLPGHSHPLGAIYERAKADYIIRAPMCFIELNARSFVQYKLVTCSALRGVSIAAHTRYNAIIKSVVDVEIRFDDT